ncbi:hypothetical protein Hanom_Chr08g00683991 [Helianthus anomalus]
MKLQGLLLFITVLGSVFQMKQRERYIPQFINILILFRLKTQVSGQVYNSEFRPSVKEATRRGNRNISHIIIHMKMLKLQRIIRRTTLHLNQKDGLRLLIGCTKIRDI